jgi:3-oxoacyl-[acyl-carrier protein] reductase
LNILLTGASRGLGLAIASKLLADGHHLWVLGRSLSEPLRKLIDDYPSCVHFQACDLQDVESLRATLSAWGQQDNFRLDGVVNNAGVAYDDLVTNSHFDKIEAMFRTNVFAPIEITRFAIRNMLLHQPAGSMVHVSSICARKGYKGLSMYAATKGALESFSRGIAREWGSRGIRSNCVVPGFMETDMSASLTEEQRSKIYQRTSLGMATDIESVASTIVFLLGPESRSITGQDIVVDSGTI